MKSLPYKNPHGVVLNVFLIPIASYLKIEQSKTLKRVSTNQLYIHELTFECNCNFVCDCRYNGYCPQFKYRIGHTFAAATSDLLADGEVSSSGIVQLRNVECTCTLISPRVIN